MLVVVRSYAVMMTRIRHGEMSLKLQIEERLVEKMRLRVYQLGAIGDFRFEGGSVVLALASVFPSGLFLTYATKIHIKSQYFFPLRRREAKSSTLDWEH